MKRMASLVLTAALGGSSFALGLGSFNFDAAKMGDYLIESDGGSHRAANWLNLANVDPGNPGALTGANFDTGVANMSGSITYTIGYNSAIVDQVGDDLGIVVARYSFDDVRFRLNDGSAWTSWFALGSGTAVSTGVMKNYWYAGGGPYVAELWVHALDMSAYGVSMVKEIEIGDNGQSPQLDLVRAGGLVPEPGTMTALALGALALLRRKTR